MKLITLTEFTQPLNEGKKTADYVAYPLLFSNSDFVGEGEKVNGLTSLPTTLYVHDHLNWDKVLTL